MVPNFGQQPRLIVTIQPAGVLPPAKLTLPNVDGLAPGEITELYSFDHDAGRFVSIGPGVVSNDGSSVTSEPGVGIIKGGWHCGGNPGQTGCCEETSEGSCADPDPTDCVDKDGSSSACRAEDGCFFRVRNVCDTCGASGTNVCNEGAVCVGCVVHSISGPDKGDVRQVLAYVADACGDVNGMTWSASPDADTPTATGTTAFTTRFTSNGPKKITFSCPGVRSR